MTLDLIEPPLSASLILFPCGHSGMIASPETVS